MGAWGPGIFDDDVALVVRETYLELLAGGVPVLDASRRVLEQHAMDLADADAAPSVWLALAATQHEYGAFGAEVLEQALRVLDSDEAYRPFEGGADAKRRHAALSRLAARLCSPLPKPRRPRRRKPVPPPPSHTVVAPDGRASVTVYELTADVYAPQRAQVLCQLETESGAGGGHLAVLSCPWDKVQLDWLNTDTALISYPAGALVEPPEPTVHRPKASLYNCGRTLAVRYRET